jgi:hypothetical protein
MPRIPAAILGFVADHPACADCRPTAPVPPNVNRKSENLIENVEFRFSENNQKN